MPVLRLLVSIVLAVPFAVFVDRAAAVVTDRPQVHPPTVARVSPRMVVVGAVLAVVFALTSVRFADASWIEAFAYLALFAVLLLLSIVDIIEYRLPDVIVLPSLVVGVLVVALVSFGEDDPARIRIAFVGAAVTFAILLVAHLVSPRGMGFGDVKLAALLGLAVGWQATTVTDAVVLVLWMLLIGFGVGSLAGVVLWIVRRRNSPFPFGPFLALGTVLTVLLGRALVG